MAVEIATAYVSLVPSARGISGKLSQELGGPIEAEGKSSGNRFIGALGGIAKRGAQATGVAVAAGFATSIAKGFGRLKAIDDARFKLQGLGHDTAAVDKIMESALASVKGTAFGLGDAATIAASAVAAGIQPGQELTRTLSLTGDAATIAGSSLDDMGAIFGKVAASNRLSMMEVNQLHLRGLPILQMVADQYGVTQDAASEMVSAGEVDFATFQKAIEDNIGGAALTAGESFGGAFANMGAALGRFGATLLGPTFEAAKGWFGDITDGVDLLGDRLGPFAEMLSGKVIAAVSAASEWFGRLGDWWGDNGPAIIERVTALGSALQDALGGALDFLGGIWTSTVEPAFTALKNIVTDTDGVVRNTLTGAFDLLVTALETVGEKFSAAGEWMEENEGIMQGVATFLAVVFVPNWIALGVQATLASIKTGIAWVVSSAGAIGAAAMTSVNLGIMIGRWAWAGVQALLHAGKMALAWVIALGPIGWVIIAVVALVALIIANWDTVVEWTRKAWTWVTDKIGQAWQWIKDTTSKAVAAVVEFFGNLRDRVVATVERFIATVQMRYWAFRVELERTVRGLRDKVVEFFGNLRDRVVTAVTTLRDRVIEFFGRIRDRVVEIATGIRDRVVEFFTGLKDGAVEQVTVLIDRVMGIKDDVLGFFANAGTWLLDAGKNIISGMIDGIKSMAGAVGRAVNDVVSSVTDRLPWSPAKKGPLRTHPPEQGGRNIITAMAGGMTSGLPSLVAAADVAARAAMPDVGAVRVPRPPQPAGSFGTDASATDWAGSGARPIEIHVHERDVANEVSARLRSVEAAYGG